MRKLCFLVALAVAGALGAPAGAITSGTPDGTAHPAVGSLVLRTPDRVFQVCTGTLVAPRVLLTAAHCLYGFEGIGFEVTFDPVITPGGTFFGGLGVVHPAYSDYQGRGGSSDPHDVGVFLLDRAPAGIVPVPVAPTGTLDRRDLHGVDILAVGYGTVRETRRTGPQGILDNLVRNQGAGRYRSLTGAWLRISMNEATGDAGTCYGDSGGPHLLDGRVVSITGGGDRQCKSLDSTYRVDTAAVHEFLDPFLAP